jgi:hypothetical protein
MLQGLGLWCLMPLSTIFQLYRGGEMLQDITYLKDGVFTKVDKAF